MGNWVSNSKRQSDILTEQYISKFLDEEGESDVISEISDDFSFYNGVQAVPWFKCYHTDGNLKNQKYHKS